MRSPRVELPTPPPFMWACPTCTEQLVGLAEAFEETERDPFCDGSLRIQITLAGHIARDHPEAVPEAHADGCEHCARYERLGNVPHLWAEHRARGLFLPEDLARLL